MSDITQQFIDAMLSAGIEPKRTSDIKPSAESRLIEDKSGKETIYYNLTIEGDRGYGRWYCCRAGEGDTWHSKSSRAWSPEEKAAWKARRDADRAAQEADTERKHKDAAIVAEATWRTAKPATTHPYLTRKGVQAHVARQDGELLLLPMYHDGKVVNVQTIDPDGGKLFLTGARKSGTYCPLTAQTDDKSTILICEGFATGASLREATGHPVMVAWDAGNLPKVAKVAREKRPEARIIVCADNDTETMVKGLPKNVGLDKAQEAAGLVSGFCIWPEMPEGKAGDFNDAHAMLGLDYVKNRIQAVAVPLPPPEQAGESVSAEVPMPPDDLQPLPGDYYDEPTIDMTGDFGLPFKVLGYNSGEYFYFPFRQRQIISLSAGSHSLNNIMQLASLDEWTDFFGGRANASQITQMATNALMRMAERRGVFKEEDRVRGCGAWMDMGRAVLHCGDILYVDGVPMDPKDVISEYVYIAAPRLLRPAPEGLSNKQSVKLRDICGMLSWENKLSGDLLAGWLVIAPICSMLTDWRPHIFITGLAGSGKSTVLKRIIKPVLGAIALNVDGGTTEPALREMLGYDGRPIIYDEAESEDEQQQRIMSGVLMLARKASSGAVVAKFGQRPFKAQFCACFSAINPSVKEFADQRRTAMLSLSKDRSPEAVSRYNAMLELISETLTPEFSRGLLTRVVENMPVLLENIKIFRAAAMKVMKAPEVSDQIAPMLAGLYLLSSSKKVSQETAEKWIQEQDWSLHTTINEDPDPVRLVHRISTSLIKYSPNSGNSRDVSIGEMIVAAIGRDQSLNQEWADRTLRQYSIVAKTNGVTIGNKNHNFERLLKNTAWSNGWGAMLAKVTGAEKVSNAYFAPGDKQRAVRLPVSLFYDGAIEQEIPFNEAAE